MGVITNRAPCAPRIASEYRPISSSCAADSHSVPFAPNHAAGNRLQLYAPKTPAAGGVGGEYGLGSGDMLIAAVRVAPKNKEFTQPNSLSQHTGSTQVRTGTPERRKPLRRVRGESECDLRVASHAMRRHASSGRQHTHQKSSTHSPPLLESSDSDCESRSISSDS